MIFFEVKEEGKDFEVKEEGIFFEVKEVKEVIAACAAEKLKDNGFVL